MNSTEINTLQKMNNQLEDVESKKKVELSQIHNPAKEITNSLASFLTSNLQRVEENADFGNLIRMHLRQRIDEATFAELMQLSHETQTDNTQTMDVLLKLFRNETSGKTVIEHLKDNEVSSVAGNLYQEADKDTLQAINYLTQALSKINQMPIIQEIDKNEN